MTYGRNVCASIQTRGVNLKTAEKYCRAVVVRQEKVIYRKNKTGKKTFRFTKETSGEVS